MKPIHLLPLALCLLASCAQQPTQSPDPADEQQLYIGDNIAVAKTQYGYVKGYILRKTYTFLGIPYGKTTEGDGRFLPAQAPTAWTDTLPTVFYAASAPQFTEATISQESSIGWRIKSFAIASASNSAPSFSRLPS